MKKGNRKFKIRTIVIISVVLIVAYIIAQILLYFRYGINMKHKYGRYIKSSFGKSTSMKLEDANVSGGSGTRKWDISYTDKNGVKRRTYIEGYTFDKGTSLSERKKRSLRDVVYLYNTAIFNIVFDELSEKYYPEMKRFNFHTSEGKYDPEVCMDYFSDDDIMVSVQISNSVFTSGAKSASAEKYIERYAKGKTGLQVKDADLRSLLASDDYYFSFKMTIRGDAAESEKYFDSAKSVIDSIIADCKTINNAEFEVSCKDETYSRAFLLGKEFDNRKDPLGSMGIMQKMNDKLLG